MEGEDGDDIETMVEDKNRQDEEIPFTYTCCEAGVCSSIIDLVWRAVSSTLKLFFFLASKYT